LKHLACYPLYSFSLPPSLYGPSVSGCRSSYSPFPFLFSTLHPEELLPDFQFHGISLIPELICPTFSFPYRNNQYSWLRYGRSLLSFLNWGGLGLCAPFFSDFTLEKHEKSTVNMAAVPPSPNSLHLTSFFGSPFPDRQVCLPPLILGRLVLGYIDFLGDFIPS